MNALSINAIIFVYNYLRLSWTGGSEVCGTANYNSGGGFVTLKIYNIPGNEIKTLMNEYRPAGSYSVTFDGQAFAGMTIRRELVFQKSLLSVLVPWW